MVQAAYLPYGPTAAAKTFGPSIVYIPNATGVPSINTDTYSNAAILALSVPITGLTLLGKPGDGKKVFLRIKDNGTAKAIALGASVVAGRAALPTTTTAGKVLDIELEWDAALVKWVCNLAASRA